MRLTVRSWGFGSGRRGRSVFGVDHRHEETAGSVARAGIEFAERACDPLRLQPGEFHGQRFAFGRGIKKALAAVVGAFLLHHISLVDELLEHAPERLLGDIQDVQKVRDLHARIAVDEMQHAVVRAPETELGEHMIGIADEVAIGEEQQLDDVPGRAILAGGSLILGSGAVADRRNRHIFQRVSAIYVSYIDIFSEDCYRELRLNERIVPVQGRGAVVAPVPEARSHEPARRYRDLAREAKAGSLAVLKDPLSGHPRGGTPWQCLFTNFRVKSGSMASWCRDPRPRFTFSRMDCIMRAACSRASAPMAGAFSRAPSIPSA
jgi:hypothetical protein